MCYRTHELLRILVVLGVSALGCTGARFRLASRPDAGGAGTGGAPMQQTDAGGASANGGGSGLGTFTPVDPQLSRLWRWQACGAIPPMTTSALQAIFPPAGDSLAVLYDDGRVVLYPKDEAAVSRTLPPTGGWLAAGIAFSLDGQSFADAAMGAVRVRDFATGAVVRNMRTNRACTGSTVRFSAEGDHVLAWDQMSLCVWQTSDGALVKQLTGDFSSAGIRGGRLFTTESSTVTGAPSSVKNWSLAGTDFSLVTLQVPPDRSLAPYFPGFFISPRGDTLVGTMLTANGVFASLWALDGTLVASFPVPVTLQPASTLFSYSASGALALLGNEVLDVGSNKHWTNTAVEPDFAGVWTVPPSISIDETGMLLAGVSGVDGVHNAATRAESGNPSALHVIGSLPPSTTSPSVLTASPDGSRLATAGYDTNSALLWRLRSDFATSVPIRSIAQGVPFEAGFSSNSRELAFSGDGWGIFSADDGRLLANLPPPAAVTDDCWFTSLQFSPSGLLLTLGTYGPAISVITRAGLKPVAQLPSTQCRARSCFSSDGTLVALTGPEVYRSSDWSLIWQSHEPPPVRVGTTGDYFRNVQFAPGDRTLVVSACNGLAVGTGCSHELRSAADGTLVRLLPGLTGSRARFSPEGNWIVSGNTALHVPTSEPVVFDPGATISTFTANGDIIAVLKDQTLVRYCRTP